MCSNPKWCGDEYEKASSKTEREMKWNIWRSWLQLVRIRWNFSQQPICRCYSKLLLMYTNIFGLGFIELYSPFGACGFFALKSICLNTIRIAITVTETSILHTFLIYFHFFPCYRRDTFKRYASVAQCSQTQIKLHFLVCTMYKVHENFEFTMTLIILAH